jgi:hypothetical protein
VIIPEVRYFHSPDAPDLARYTPPNPVSFALLVQIIVGPSNAPGEESADVHVVTPHWLEQQLDDDTVLSCQHKVLVATYDWPKIERYLRARVSQCTATDWAGVGQKLSRFARWEFEDYTPRDTD